MPQRAGHWWEELVAEAAVTALVATTLSTREGGGAFFDISPASNVLSSVAYTLRENVP